MLTKAQKLVFVKSLCNAIRNNLCDDITSMHIPENWDGVELRELLAEKFAREKAHLNKRGSRYREFVNTVLVNNL